MLGMMRLNGRKLKNGSIIFPARNLIKNESKNMPFLRLHDLCILVVVSFESSFMLFIEIISKRHLYSEFVEILAQMRVDSACEVRICPSLLLLGFIGVGNPAESGAHLLYFFRQVNHLSKDLFADIHEAFAVRTDNVRGEVYEQRNGAVSRYVFFDDLVGSGDQVSIYLKNALRAIRKGTPSVELRFLSLFATSAGIARLNEKQLFDGKAFCLFELDDSYKAFDVSNRYFSGAPSWFATHDFWKIALSYGSALQPLRPLGYKDGQLLLGFSHNTPDNTLPIFWDEGVRNAWNPVFQRYDKK
jgi:hypothetical protein